MIEDLRRMEAEEDEEELALPGSRPRSGAAREPKEEFPRPMSSQVSLSLTLETKCESKNCSCIHNQTVVPWPCM